MKVLQFTDPHLYGSSGGNLRGVETDASLRGVLREAQIALKECALVLVTGDIVQDDPSGYERFKNLFGSLAKPVLCIPGNHDEPDVMRRSLSGAPFQYCGEHAAGGWQFIMLNSCDPGHECMRWRARQRMHS